MQLTIIFFTFIITLVLARNLRYSFLMLGTYREAGQRLMQISRYHTQRHKAKLDRFYNYTFEFEEGMRNGEVIHDIVSLPPQYDAVHGRYTHLLVTHTPHKQPKLVRSRLLLAWGESETIVSLLELKGELILTATFFCGPPNRYGSCAPEIEFVKVSAVDSACRLIHKKIKFVYDERLPEQDITTSCVLPRFPFYTYTPDHMSIVENKLYGLDFIRSQEKDDRENIRLTIWTTTRPIKRPTNLSLFRFISILFWPDEMSESKPHAWTPLVHEHFSSNFCSHRNVTIRRVQSNSKYRLVYELYCHERDTNMYFIYNLETNKGYLSTRMGVAAVRDRDRIVAYHEGPNGLAYIYASDNFYSKSGSGELHHNNIHHRNFDQYFYAELFPLV